MYNLGDQILPLLYTFINIIQVSLMFLEKSLREKGPNAELFLVRIQTEYRKIRTRNNSVFEYFLRSEYFKQCIFFQQKPVSYLRDKKWFNCFGE